MKNKLFAIFAIAVTTNFNATYANTSNNNDPIEIIADRLIVKQNNSIAIFSGNVEAVQGDINLKSNEMTVHYESEDRSSSDSVESSKISQIDAKGNVFITTPTESASGNKGSYNIEKGIINLDGDVVLNRGQNIIKGSNLIHNINQGTTEIQNNSNSNANNRRVRGVFIPKKNGDSE